MSLFLFLKTPFIRLVFLAALLLSAFVSIVQAQMTGLPSTTEKAATTVTLPDPLTPEAVRELVSKLSDKEVRDLLLNRLDAVAKEKAAGAGVDQSATSVITNAFANVGKVVQRALMAAPNIPPGISAAFQNFMGDRGTSGLLKFLGFVLFSIILGFVGGWVVNFFTRSLRERIQLQKPEGLWETVRTLLIRLVLDLLKVAAFAMISLLATRYLHDSAGDKQLAGRFITTVLIFVLFSAALTRFATAPNRPELRLLSIDNEMAKLFFSQTIWLAALMGVGPFVVSSLAQYGIPMGTLLLGFWITLALHLGVIAALYLGRRGMTDAIRGNDNLMGLAGLRFAERWPWIAIALIGCNWLLVEILAGAQRFDLLQGQQYVTLLLVLFSPLFDTSIRGLVRHLTPPLIGEGEIAERAHLATQRAYLRMGRVVLLALIVMLLARLFGIDYSNTESVNASERLVARVIDGTLYFFLGYFVWEGVGVWINRRLAKEQTDSGIDMNSDEPGGGEGGGTGISRLATVLPVIRLVVLSTIVVMTALLGLSRLGVDTTPLLAGAGIVGLAIGFGAQTLVRDVVSGMFFLIDDAFRVGEYLVIDDTVGTVEKISIRSLQLRHHKGPVHTIPYGEIPKVTNNSRDWVITKLKFTFPFETDPNQIKKIFKRIGAEMLEADYAADIIQTFKSQGVYDVDDVGIVIRGKFMTKPGTQWIIRKDIYSRVNKALEEAGIQFARREVRVQIPGMEVGTQLTEDQAKAVGAAASGAVPEPVSPSK